MPEGPVFETGAIPNYAIPATLNKTFKTFIYLTLISKQMEDLELKYDSKRLKEFWKKNKTIILILIPLFLAIFFRAYTYELPLTDDMAMSSIEENLKSQIRSEILAQSSDIDQNSLDMLTEQRYRSFLETNKGEIDAQAEQLSQTIKQYYQDDSGQTYLLAIDPYHYYRQAQNLLENGHVGDELIDGKSLDNHMLAPNGRQVGNNFHPYIGATLHKISQFFGNDSLLKTMFILPLIFAALSIIPTFFITRRIAGNMGGFVAALIVAIHPTFLGRTPAGFSDTDAYAVFFPLMIIWLFLESFTAIKTKNKYLLGSLAGLFTGIFAFAWVGWWYIFDILIGSLATYFIYLLIKYKGSVFRKLKTKNLIKTAIAYLISSFVFVSIFSGFSNFANIITGPLSILILKEAAHATLWPNVYTTVAELNAVSMTQVISALSGKIFFGLATLGILLIFFKKRKLQIDIKYGILLVLWYIATLATTTRGARFIMYMVPVFAVGLGIFYGKVYTLITNWGSRELDLNKTLLAIGLIIITIASLTPLISATQNAAMHEVPSMNDAWYDALTKIKEESPENAIINSWWDFGHWFKAIGDRAVTFDGASQNTPPAHWIGKTLLTSNEAEAIAILRMLDCGSNDAYNILLEKTEDPITTKRIIDEIIIKDENEARTILSDYTDNPDEILEKTHCNPPENYFITSEDMVSKAGVWGHFGSWDFERAFAYDTIKSNSKEDAISNLIEIGYSQEEAESTFRQLNGLDEQQANAWIAPYPSYAGSGQCQTQNETIYCTNGLVITKDNEAFVQTNSGQAKLNSFRIDNEIFKGENGTDEISAAYISDSQTSILMQSPLLESMFTELYYYQGKYVENFELFDHQQGIDGFDIYTWKVKWT
jgi:dolichyl-phosphooligosaccharide-protein glycotransferase